MLNEDILWEILLLMQGHTASWEVRIVGMTTHNEIKNGYIVEKLKASLILKFSKSDIEDTVYFMKKRGYLKIHGQGIVFPELAYSMTDKAKSVFDKRVLPPEEREAFKESLLKIEPKIYWVRLNFCALKKLFAKWWNKYREGIYRKLRVRS